MKITRKQLKRLIEMAFDPSLYPSLSKKIDDIKSSGPIDYPERDKRRSMGLITREEGDEEKDAVRRYNNANRKELMKFFAELRKPNGRITALHAPGYRGAVTNKRQYSDNIINSPIGWVNQFGLKGKDDMSVILVPQNIQNLGKAVGESNDDVVFDSPYSLIMSGYPKMINYEDMMTQTISALPKELVDFQASSGITKSYLKEPSINNLEGFVTSNITSQETVLDNWEVKGVLAVMIDFEDAATVERNPDYFVQRTINLYKQLSHECEQLGLPFHALFSRYNKPAFKYGYRYKRVK